MKSVNFDLVNYIFGEARNYAILIVFFNFFF